MLLMHLRWEPIATLSAVRLGGWSSILSPGTSMLLLVFDDSRLHMRRLR